MQCYRNMRLAEKIEVYRKNFLLSIVILLKTRQGDDQFKFVGLFVAKVRQQVVVVVADHRR